MPRPSLDDPDYRRFAWDRYWRLMRWMALLSATTVVVGLAVLKLMLGTVPLHMAIAASLGVFFSVLLAAALMGLVFLGSGSGHDEAVDDRVEEEEK